MSFFRDFVESINRKKKEFKIGFKSKAGAIHQRFRKKKQIANRYTFKMM
jgi:hypothetical protein